MISRANLARQVIAAAHGDEPSPEDRMEFIRLPADYERIAVWLGGDWSASDPSLNTPLCRFVASIECATDNVIDLSKVRRLLKGK